MGSVTKKWVFLKVSSAILIPLMIWFAMSLASIYDKGYIEDKNIKNAANKTLNIFAIVFPLLIIILVFNL